MKNRQRKFVMLGVGLGAAIVTVIAWRWTPPEAAWKQAHTYARLASPGPLASAHAELAADCEACHEPGAGATALRCASCHAVESALLAQPETRFHADVTTCISCHPEHREAPRLVGAFLHDQLAEAGAWTLGLDPTGAADALDCVTCHGASEPHAGYFGDVCLSCHSTATWSVPGYRHPADRSGHCGECHKPPPNHFNPMFAAKCAPMLGHASGAIAECDGCHTTAGWDEIRGAPWHRDTMSHKARRSATAGASNE